MLKISWLFHLSSPRPLKKYYAIVPKEISGVFWEFFTYNVRLVLTFGCEGEFVPPFQNLILTFWDDMFQYSYIILD